MILVGQQSLLYFELNKPNKQNVSEINLFKKFNFSQSQNTELLTHWLISEMKHGNIATSNFKINT